MQKSFFTLVHLLQKIYAICNSLTDLKQTYFISHKDIKTFT